MRLSLSIMALFCRSCLLSFSFPFRFPLLHFFSHPSIFVVEDTSTNNGVTELKISMVHEMGRVEKLNPGSGETPSFLTLNRGNWFQVSHTKSLSNEQCLKCADSRGPSDLL